MSQPATTIITGAAAPIGGGKHTPPTHTVSAQHLGPFDPAARIAALEERITALEAKVFDRTAAK